jgi:hypothetical protein
MTAEVARRFATPNEAIGYVLDHNLPRAEAEVLFKTNGFDAEKAWAIVEEIEREGLRLRRREPS